MLPLTYSRRKRQAETSAVDVYEYSIISKKVRIQVVQIIKDGLGPYYDSFGNTASGPLYDFIVKQVRRDVGVHQLVGHARHPEAELFKWLEEVNTTDDWLDAVELSLKVVDRVVKAHPNTYSETEAAPDDTIQEFNARMQEAALGYQYVSGEIVRADSFHLHREVVVPALTLLANPRFQAAEQEYRSAHHAFRHGELEDSLVDCGKAFESVLKVIGTARRWPINDSDPASKLIQAAVNAGFLATYSSASLNHLKGLLESSTPTVRNKQGGHGAGVSPRTVPRELAALQLHQTAAVILFLVELDRR
ncbi:STM4504/CBY_0614 family protein [uncultured Enterovirga sp.]|uniref:STM4504/CBY_0614 family protein n=1 Tax=uncultured Enterovirga sp. TaxID=2026352 RepID=UPI0035CC0EB4